MSKNEEAHKGSGGDTDVTGQDQQLEEKDFRLVIQNKRDGSEIILNWEDWAEIVVSFREEEVTRILANGFAKEVAVVALLNGRDKLEFMHDLPFCEWLSEFRKLRTTRSLSPHPNIKPYTTINEMQRYVKAAQGMFDTMANTFGALFPGNILLAKAGKNGKIGFDVAIWESTLKTEPDLSSNNAV